MKMMMEEEEGGEKVGKEEEISITAAYFQYNGLKEPLILVVHINTTSTMPF
jgi:hypothetical protein